MKRHLTAAILTGALALAPVAAFAQDAEPAEATAETSALESLAAFLSEAAEALLAGPDVAQDATEEDAEAAQVAFDALKRTIGELLAGVAEGLYIESMEAEGLAIVANLEDETEDDDEGDEAGGANGEAVSTLAHCAPRGSFKDLLEGMATHGAYVTAAAHGETVGLNVPVLGEDEAGNPVVTTEAEVTDFDLTTVEGAEDLCSALDVVYRARLLELELAWDEVDSTKDARVLAREACKIERLRSKTGSSDADAKAICAELKQRVADLRDEQKAAAKADRDAAKADRHADRDARKAERDAARADKAAARADAKSKRGSSED